MSFVNRRRRALHGWRDQGESFHFHGHDFFFRDSDPGRTGPVLLLLHGFPTSSWDWHAVWDELADRFRLIAPDLLGFGFSDKPRGYEYSIFEQASMVEDLLQREGIGSYHVLAHDYGDTVAQELLARNRERSARGTSTREIRSVCLLNGGLFFEAIRKRPLQRLLESPVGGLVSRLMSRPLFDRRFSKIFGPETRPSEAQLANFWRLVSHDDGHLVAHEICAYLGERERFRDRWAEALDATRVPVRLISGREDPVSGPSIARRYREVVTAPDVVELEGIGHYPHVEAPQRTLAAYVSFVRQYIEGG